MWSKYGLAALALQSFAQKASAGVAKRADYGQGPVTLTRTITHNSYYGADGTPTAVTDTQTIVPTTLTSIVDGSTIFVDHTITLDCTYCDAAKASKTALLTNTNQLPAATTGGESSSETGTGDDEEDCPADGEFDYTTPGESETAAATGGESSGETPIPSYGGSESKTTGGENSGATASSISYSPAGGENSGESAIPSYGGSDSNTSGGQNSGVTAGGSSYPPIGSETTGGESSPNETPVSEQGASSIPYTPSSVILGTGNNAIPTPGGGIWTNSTSSSPVAESGESSPEQTGGLVVTETITGSGGSVTTAVSEVTQIVAQPVIIVIRQVTIFTFTFALGGNCPAVQSHSSGGFIVGKEGSDSQTFPGLGDACSSACYKQFKTCTSAAGQNFKVSDCEDQLSACLGSAATHTAKDSSPTTLTQNVYLPPDATSNGNNYINGGGVVIKTRTLTVGEVCTIGDGSVGVITATNVPASLTSAFDATVTSSVPMVETTKNVGVTYTNEQGSTLTSYTTLTLTVPCSKCAAGSGTQVVASQTTASSAEGVVPSGSETSHYTVITMSNTVPNANGQGSTVIYTESTYAIPTAAGTGTGSTNTRTAPGGNVPGNGNTIPSSGETTSVPGLSSYANTQTAPGSSETTSGESSPGQTPGSPGGPNGHTSVVTFTNTVPNSNGQGSTVVYSESTYAIPTGAGTGTGSVNTRTVPGGGNSAETASVPAVSSYANTETAPGSSETTSGESSPEQTPGSPGGSGGRTSVITLTNTVPNANGQGSTVVYSQSTYVIPTAVGTGTGIPNTRTVPGSGAEGSTVVGNSGETPTGVVPGGGSESTAYGGLTTSGESSPEQTPGSPGGSGGRTSVITLTNTVPNANGQGSTVVYSESTYVIPTALGTGTGVAQTTAATETDQSECTTCGGGYTQGVSTAQGGVPSITGAVTGNEGQYSTSLITMSIPGSGTHSGTISVVTMTISGGSPAGSGTGQVPGPTPEITQPGGGENSGETPGGGNNGNNGGYTSYITMTMSPTCAGCAPEETVVTQTYQQPGNTAAGGGSNVVQTQYVTVTMGGQTGVVPVTATATPKVSTMYVTVGGENSGQTVTVGGGGVSTVYVTQAGGAQTVTVGGGSEKTVTVTGAERTVTVTEQANGGSCPTGCPASCMSEAAKTLATQTTKQPETVYVTQTVNNAINTSYPSKAKWRRVIGM